jgi:hypothetical protein
MNLLGASTAATASADADGVAASDISGAADSDADGVAVGAASSLFDAGREITITARSAIPRIAAINTRGEVPCLGAELGLAGADFAGVGVVVTLTRDVLVDPPRGTGGITILLAEVDFFAAAFFRAGAFFAAFFTTFLAAAFFRAGAFLVIFFAAAFFFAGAFFAAFFTTFLAAVFFLTGAFFFTATVKLLKD